MKQNNNDKAASVFYKLLNNKHPNNLFEYIKNYRFKAEQMQKLEDEAKNGPNLPDLVYDHIRWLK